MVLRSLLAGLILSLTACSMAPITDETSPFYSLPVGSSLELHQSLDIQPNHARTFIQYGKVIKEKAIDRYYPYCEFEISTLSDDIQTIMPDVFEIYKVNDNEHEVSRYFMYASLFLTQDDGPLILGYATEYSLRSEQQPQVHKLICLYWDDPNTGKYLSLTDIKQALGKIFSIYPK